MLTTIDNAKKSTKDVLKPASKISKKTAEATGDLAGNKIADKITKVQRNLPQNSSETIANETENIEVDRE